MKIVVCAKHVPDIQAERRFTSEGRVDRGRGDGTVNEVDENALEAARRIAETRDDVEVVVVTMGPAPALDAVRRGLQMGADRGVHVLDDALAGSDVFATARVLAAAIRRIGDVDLVLVGMAALDSLTSLLPAALAEELELPALTIASELEITDGAARVRRALDDVVETLEAPLPALVSVTDGINSPRFPNFQAIMAAREKPVEAWSLAELGIEADTVGEAAARTRVLEVGEIPPREHEVFDTDDDGAAGARLAEHLVRKGFVTAEIDPPGARVTTEGTVAPTATDATRALATTEANDAPASPNFSDASAPADASDAPAPSASGETSAGPVIAVLDPSPFGQPGAELLTAVRRVAEGLGSPLEAVWAGALDDDVAATLSELGVERVHHLPAPARSSTELAGALAALAERTAPAAILATTSFATRELAARLGVRLGCGVLVGAAHVEVADGQIEAERTSFAATWGSRCAVLDSPAIVTVKPHATAPEPARSPSAPEIVELNPGTPDERVRVVERTARVATGRPDLASAAVVVAGGRGTEGDFSLLGELADELGGALGATRVATDEGWVGHELQVGQTGVTINPVLYIGAGISGAAHHVGGMRAAQHVVAINTDPDAPLAQLADYVVIGDLVEVVQGTLTRLRELRG